MARSSRFTVEQHIVANEVLLYMREHNVCLEEAYEQKGVPEEMRLTSQEIDEIYWEEVREDMVL